MTILLTGGAGFIGSAFLRLVLQRLPEAKVVILDALTYAGNLSTIDRELKDPRVRFYRGLIQDQPTVEEVFETEGVTHVANFAAESHNDRSMLLAGSFIQSNTYGVYILLEAARKCGVERFLHVSTDEVYGTIDSGQFTEESPLQPNTPYSASKAGGDLQVRAHVKAYGTPAIVTRGGNTYGPFQFPEKLIPFFVTRLIDGKKVPMYGDGSQVREWIYVDDHAGGVLHALLHGQFGEVYNIGAPNERENREVVKILLEETGRDESLVKRIPDPRHGAHDKRYSMTTGKMTKLGWSPQKPFEEGLRQTVRWYVENEAWWRPLISTEEFRSFVARFYGPSLGDDL
jgi:dTDP-glucose 4,6-dehydratase